MKDRIYQLQQMLVCTCGLEFACIPRSRADVITLFRQRTAAIFDLLVREDDRFFQEILELQERHDTIYEISTPGDVLFFCYVQSDLLFLFGPLLARPFSIEDTIQRLKAYQFPLPTQNVMLEYLGTIPVIPADRVYRIVEISLRQLLDLDAPLKVIRADCIYSLENMLRSTPPQLSPEISQMRLVEERYEFGTALIEAIKQGNSSLAFHIVGQYTPGSDTAVRNQNPLRNAQNYCIIFNTQLRHAMEQCGIHPYRVDKLSNEIGVQIEQMTEISKLRDFFGYMIRQYCRMVQKHAYPNLNPLTNLTVEYIKEHLSENITVKDTAKALTVNANYLSTQFHENMGISFIDFVNQERIHQAAALLGNTHLQVQQICQIVGYNNTSYFSKQFARYMGTSPRAYRQQHNPNA